MKKLVAGNWKMNGTLASAASLADSLLAELAGRPVARCDIVLCPPHLHLTTVYDRLKENGGTISLGGQDCSNFESGAYTGDVSPAMLKDAGCSHVILGHSERRQYHGETDDIIAGKAALAHSHGLVTIICVGESEEERTRGAEADIVGFQLDHSLPAGTNAHNTVIAYEPVWAIGTGKTATAGDVADMHHFIREKLKEKLADFQDVRILYGGSVKAENAHELFSVRNVDGALVGGASLKADQFAAIIAAAA